MSTPMRDEADALAELREINKKLLLVAFAEVPDRVARLCDEARALVIAAVREIVPLKPHDEPPPEERDPAEHRAQLEKDATKFDDITNPPGLN